MCCVKACVFQSRIKREKEVDNLQDIITQDRAEIQVRIGNQNK